MQMLMQPNFYQPNTHHKTMIMLLRKSHYAIAICLSSAFIFACSTNSSSPDTAQISDTTALPQDTTAPTAFAIRPPFDNISVPVQSYKINANKAQTIRTPKGSVIDIPANIFRDIDGKPITGEIEIRFREFHTAAEILASGIPMTNPETGDYMESAGMFEITGWQHGEEITIYSPRQTTINVKLASFNEGNKFDFFKLNPKDCRWAEIDGDGTIPAQKNKDKKIRLQEIEKQLGKEPQKPISSKECKNFVFDLDINYSEFPEFKSFKGVTWEYCGTADATNPEKQTWVLQTDWEQAKISANDGKSYKLTLSTHDKKFETEVRPVLKGKDFEKAMADFNKNMEKYAKKVEEIAAQREALTKQANVLREFNISGFGIYNWDYWQKAAGQTCETTFVFEDTELSNSLSKEMTFFLVINAENAVIPFPVINLKSNVLRFDPYRNNTIVAVLPNNKLAIIDHKSFKKIDANKLDRTSKLNLYFNNTHIKTVKSVEDIQAVINQIG